MQLLFITDEVSKLYNDFKFGVAITKIMECIQQVSVWLAVNHKTTTLLLNETYVLQGNAFLQRHQPWVLIKHPEEQPWLDTVLHMALECVRLCCVLLYPIVPQSMTEVRHRLGLPAGITTQDLQCRLNRKFITRSDYIPGASTKLNSSSTPLFKKLWDIKYFIVLWIFYNATFCPGQYHT